MAARHLDEGLLGWALAATAILSGLGLCGLAGYIGHQIRNFDNHLAEL